MVRYELLVVAVIMALSIHEASAIKCYVCNNLNSKSCDDPFDASKLSEFDKLAMYTDCASNKCIKLSVVTNLMPDKPTITRLCAKTPEEATKFCTNTSSQKDFKCDICETDGCNSGIQYGPVALLVVASAAIVKMFTF